MPLSWRSQPHYQFISFLDGTTWIPFYDSSFNSMDTIIIGYDYLKSFNIESLWTPKYTSLYDTT